MTNYVVLYLRKFHCVLLSSDVFFCVSKRYISIFTAMEAVKEILTGLDKASKMRMVSQRPHVFYAEAFQWKACRCPALVPDREDVELKGLRWEGHGTSRCFLSLDPCRSRVKSLFGVSCGAQSSKSLSNMGERSVLGASTQ